VRVLVCVTKQAWKALCKTFRQKPIDMLALFAGLMKGLQFVSLALFLRDLFLPNTILETIMAIPFANLILSLLLFSVGQSLNIGVYKALGMKGVYYGVKFGAKIPWHEGFPFNVCPHPQYVGSSLTVWAALMPFMNLNSGAYLYDLVPVGTFWSACYILSSVVEAR